MAEMEKRKSKLLVAAERDYRKLTIKSKREKLESRAWSDLPTELLELIFRHLYLEDNIHVSVVCKRWHTAAISVRVINQSPWLMHFPKHGNLHEFYDPAECKTYSIELPELYGSRVCYTKDGWLLLYRPRTQSVFFFHPFTKEVIKLPRLKFSCEIIAFSAAPTSTSCVIFTVKDISLTVVAISTCRPGATEWVTVNYQYHFRFVSGIWNKVVFCSGVFYCLSLTGWLGVFDPVEYTWNVIDVPRPKIPGKASNLHSEKFMSEHNGDIFVIYACVKYPIVFKLSQSNMVWEEMKTLDGVTLFASFLSSYSRTNLPGIMTNSVYFPKVCCFGKHCITYSLDDRKYYPYKQYWGEQDPFEYIWIEPPEDLSIFI